MISELWISALIFLLGVCAGNFLMAGFRIWGKTFERAASDTFDASFYIITFLAVISLIGVLR